MAMNHAYANVEPARIEIDALREPAVIEFGVPWCEYCLITQPLIEAAMANHSGVIHLKIKDGKNRRLGRSFGVKLWPTLVFLSNGKEVARLVRPTNSKEISVALTQIEVAA